MDCVGTFAAIAFSADPILSVRAVDHRSVNGFSLPAGVLRTRARDFARLDRMVDGEEAPPVPKDFGSQILAIGQSQGALATEPETTHLDLNLRLWKPCRALLEVLAQPGKYSQVCNASDPWVIGQGMIAPTDLTATEAVTTGIRYPRPPREMAYLAIACRQEVEGLATPADHDTSIFDARWMPCHAQL
jgi:hypothetical protein